MNTRGATTSATKHAADSNNYFFGPRRSDFSGAAAFFRLLKKSPRFGIGISAPRLVVCFFMSSTLPCIFCPNRRTRKRGEHVWDDWLNREHGKDIYDPSTTYY